MTLIRTTHRASRHVQHQGREKTQCCLKGTKHVHWGFHCRTMEREGIFTRQARYLSIDRFIATTNAATRSYGIMHGLVKRLLLLHRTADELRSSAWAQTALPNDLMGS